MDKKQAKPIPRSHPIREEAIRARAFEKYQERLRGGVQGDAVSDWYAAEREVAQIEPREKERRRR